MILQALCDLAHREGLADPDFEDHRIDFVIRVSADGDFLSLEPTSDASGRSKVFRVPSSPERTSAIRPGFLQDKAMYVLGIGIGSTDRIAQCATAFRSLVSDAERRCDDAGIAAVSRFVERLSEHRTAVFAIRAEDEWSGSEWIAFELEHDTLLVHERAPSVRTWVAMRREESERRPRARCLVSGESSPIERVHGKIKLRLPGSQSGGSSLVSFNEAAFESFGHEQGENAPISEDSARAYVRALNHLLERTETRIYRYGVRLGEAVTVFWTRDAHPDVDALASFFEPSRDDAVRTAEAPYRGSPSGDLDATAFFALTLGGNAARVVVRDWFSTTMAVVKENVRRYFDDLAIGGRSDQPIPIARLIDALKTLGRNSSTPPELATRIFRAALRGEPFPREILGLALRRLRIPPPSNRKTDSNLHPRCALIKATLRRLPCARANTQEITVSLNEDETGVAYLLGRLFAVLERLQGAALGDLNASIRDRFFGAASATPAVVFPRLLRLSVHHVSKSEGYGVHLERVKGSIIDKLPSHGFPAILGLEDQGLFAVGYYHQREDFFVARKDKDKAKKDN